MTPPHLRSRCPPFTPHVLAISSFRHARNFGSSLRLSSCRAERAFREKSSSDKDDLIIMFPLISLNTNCFLSVHNLPNGDVRLVGAQRRGLHQLTLSQDECFGTPCKALVGKVGFWSINPAAAISEDKVNLSPHKSLDDLHPENVEMFGECPRKPSSRVSDWKSRSSRPP